jgi:hypothetical protein
MICARCEVAEAAPKKRWCAECELAYDGWVRQYASDIIGPALGGGFVVMMCAMVLPVLGISTLIAGVGAIAGFATLFGLTRYNMRRRRKQFKATLPRAYLR